MESGCSSGALLHLLNTMIFKSCLAEEESLNDLRFYLVRNEVLIC